MLALESHLRARVYYKASFSGSISTDHGNEQFDGRRYWNWELKYLLRYNGIPNVQVMYQDIEVKFYSRIQYAMDNEVGSKERGFHCGNEEFSEIFCVML